MGHVLRPHQRTSYAPPSGREDCWTEEATSALIDAWGERFLELNRGNLRQKDWKDVAVAVNRRPTASNAPKKSDAQCKNRIDTLKKKFKVEKSKENSDWVFFSRLEQLLSTPISPPIRFTIKRNETVERDSVDESSSGSKANDSCPLSCESLEEVEGKAVGRVFSGPRRDWGSSLEVGNGRDGAFGELAKAIEKFGEVYEKVETSRQQQMVELERQRLEFAKEIEFRWMQVFVEAQIELERNKRPKVSSGNGKQL